MIEAEEDARNVLAKKYFAAYCSAILRDPQEMNNELKEAEEVVIYLSRIIRKFVDVLSFERIPGQEQKVKEECEALVYYGFFTHYGQCTRQ